MAVTSRSGRSTRSNAQRGHNSVAMLVRRDGETLNALLKRLDKAIGQFYEHDAIIDEVSGI